MSDGVTVIVVGYNHAAFVAECLRSVLAQSQPPSAVLAVDSGSSDATSAEMERFADLGVRLLRLEPVGVCVARNTAAELAATPLLLFLDGDDRLCPGFLAATSRALRRRPTAALAYTPWRYFGHRSGLHPSLPWRSELLAAGNTIANAALLRTAAFRAVGGFDLRWNRRGWEDWDLWLRFAEAGFRGVLVDEPLLEVRTHAAGNRNRTAEADAALAADILAAHPRLAPRGPLSRWGWKLWRRAGLAIRWAGHTARGCRTSPSVPSC